MAQGQNVAIDYRWANNQMERLPALELDLVNRNVSVLVTVGGGQPAQHFSVPSRGMADEAE